MKPIKRLNTVRELLCDTVVVTHSRFGNAKVDYKPIVDRWLEENWSDDEKLHTTVMRMLKADHRSAREYGWEQWYDQSPSWRDRYLTHFVCEYDQLCALLNKTAALKVVCYQTPETIRSLQVAYENDDRVTPTVIRHFAQYNPTDPKGAVERFLADVKELEQEYADDDLVTSGFIHHFARGYPADPKAAVERFIGHVAELEQEYADDERITLSVIRRFAQGKPDDPKAGVERFLELFDQTRSAHPEETDGAIRRAVLHRLEDPASLLA